MPPGVAIISPNRGFVCVYELYSPYHGSFNCEAIVQQFEFVLLCTSIDFNVSTQCKMCGFGLKTRYNYTVSQFAMLISPSHISILVPSIIELCKESEFARKMCLEHIVGQIASQSGKKRLSASRGSYN